VSYFEIFVEDLVLSKEDRVYTLPDDRVFTGRDEPVRLLVILHEDESRRYLTRVRILRREEDEGDTRSS